MQVPADSIERLAEAVLLPFPEAAAPTLQHSL